MEPVHSQKFYQLKRFVYSWKVKEDGGGRTYLLIFAFTSHLLIEFLPLSTSKHILVYTHTTWTTSSFVDTCSTLSSKLGWLLEDNCIPITWYWITFSVERQRYILSLPWNWNAHLCNWETGSSTSSITDCLVTLRMIWRINRHNKSSKETIKPFDICREFRFLKLCFREQNRNKMASYAK